MSKERIRKEFDFNPRPHEEGDAIYDMNIIILWIFQSTPSRGGRPKSQGMLY